MGIREIIEAFIVLAVIAAVAGPIYAGIKLLEAIERRFDGSSARVAA